MTYPGTHHLSRTRTYKSWSMMRARCNNPNNTNYQRYGGRGVRVCSRWIKFEEFLADMGIRPVATSLDRIDPFGNYEPSNCRWATRQQQSNNMRRSLGYQTLDGERVSVREMAVYLAIPDSTLYYKLRVYR